MVGRGTPNPFFCSKTYSVPCTVQCCGVHCRAAGVRLPARASERSEDRQLVFFVQRKVIIPVVTIDFAITINNKKEGVRKKGEERGRGGGESSVGQETRVT